MDITFTLQSWMIPTIITVICVIVAVITLCLDDDYYPIVGMMTLFVCFSIIITAWVMYALMLLF